MQKTNCVISINTCKSLTSYTCSKFSKANFDKKQNMLATVCKYIAKLKHSTLICRIKCIETRVTC